MSGSTTSTTSSTITVAAPPTTEEVAADFLTWIGAQNPILTDVNPGSQVRTMGEAIGSVVDMESVTAQAMALQALVTCGISLPWTLVLFKKYKARTSLTSQLSVSNRA